MHERYSSGCTSGKRGFETYAEVLAALDALDSMDLLQGVGSIYFSGYSVADLKEMESRPEKPVPRIITSRLSGAMQMPHVTLRGW